MIFRPLRFLRDSVLFGAGLAGIAGVFIWITEADQRREQRLVQRMQLAMSASEILARVVKAESDNSVEFPTDDAVGLALEAMSLTSEVARAASRQVFARCSGDGLSGPVELEGAQIYLVNCDLTGEDPVSMEALNDGRISVTLESLRIGEKSVLIDGRRPNIILQDVEAVGTTIRLERIDGLVFSSRRSSLRDVVILQSVSNRGGFAYRKFNINNREKDDQFVLKWPEHGCREIKNKSRVRGVHQEFFC